MNHQAANVAGALERVGFVVQETADASTEGIGKLSRTEVRYAPGDQAQAELVARHLSAPVELVPVVGGSTGTIEVVTGSDFTTVTTTKRTLHKSELPGAIGLDHGRDEDDQAIGLVDHGDRGRAPTGRPLLYLTTVAVGHFSA